MQKKYSNIIIEFIKAHSLISDMALEKLVSAPQSTIGAAKNGSRDIPAKHIFNLIYELVGYGLKIDGYTLERDEGNRTILGRKFISEVDYKEKNSGFTYIVEESRIMITDFHDLP